MPNIVGFLDATVRRVCRPSWFQRVCYSGHRKFHCLKFQNVIFPDGIIAHQWGPAEGRRSDAYVLWLSRLVPFLREHLKFFLPTPADRAMHQPIDPNMPDGVMPATLGNPPYIQYGLYGDKGYSVQADGCVQVPFKRYGNHQLTALEQLFNSQMSKVRISVEWGFLRTLQTFAYLDHWKQMKVWGTPVGPYYKAATILTNCYTCLYPQKALPVRYFNVQPPALEDYLHFTV